MDENILGQIAEVAKSLMVKGPCETFGHNYIPTTYMDTAGYPRDGMICTKCGQVIDTYFGRGIVRAANGAKCET